MVKKFAYPRGEKLEYPKEKQFSYEDGWNWLKDFYKENLGDYILTDYVLKAMGKAEEAKTTEVSNGYVFEMPISEATELVGSLTVNDLEGLDDYKSLGGLRGYIYMFKEEEEENEYNYLSLRNDGVWCFKNANTGEFFELSEKTFYNILRKKYEEKHSAAAQCEEIEVEDSDTRVFSLVGFKTLLECQKDPNAIFCADILDYFLRHGRDALLWKDGEWYVSGRGLSPKHLCRDSGEYPQTVCALDYIKDNHLMPYFWED